VACTGRLVSRALTGTLSESSTFQIAASSLHVFLPRECGTRL
jgi:hypothetical protein